MLLKTSLFNLLLGIFLLSLNSCMAQTPRIKMILDSDTANEIDDLYAIIRTIPEKRFEVLGLSSAQWFHRLSGDSTVYASQRLNEELLALMGRSDLPHPIGSDIEMGMPWGGREARDSPAAQFIIEAARDLPEGDSLYVVCIGAATNLASAISMAPEIVPRLRVYVLGFRYDHEGYYWNKDEFNIRRDLNAANFLLDTEGLDLHIMPISVAIQYQFDRAETFQKLKPMGELGSYLKGKWLERFPDNDTWVMWDVALIEAILYPQWAPQVQVSTPPENTARKVWMYTDIDEVKMLEEYWRYVQLKFGK
ncbi:MAG: nucleoside hydrolase [Bacteroidota bacterium]